MPLYIYRCSTCEREVEELQKMGADEPPTIECPEGGNCAMTKVITRAGLKFIGEGWGGWEANSEGFAQRSITGKRTSWARKKQRKPDTGV